MMMQRMLCNDDVQLLIALQTELVFVRTFGLPIHMKSPFSKLPLGVFLTNPVSLSSSFVVDFVFHVSVALQQSSDCTKKQTIQCEKKEPKKFNNKKKLEEQGNEINDSLHLLGSKSPRLQAPNT